MTKHFVVAVQGLTSEEEKQLSNLFKGKCAWWHWIDGFWLLVDTSDTLDAGTIRSMIADVNSEARRIVLEVSNSGDWAGYGPTGEKNNMFRWIRETWEK